MTVYVRLPCAALLIALLSAPAGGTATDGPTREAAERMERAANTSLAPVYAPLAEQIVLDYGLRQRRGVGIDIGGGPGHLVVELSRRTPHLQWINADYNLHYEYIIHAVSACSGQLREMKGGSTGIVRFVEKIKFAPPRRPANAGT